MVQWSGDDFAALLTKISQSAHTRSPTDAHRKLLVPPLSSCDPRASIRSQLPVSKRLCVVHAGGQSRRAARLRKTQTQLAKKNAEDLISRITSPYLDMRTGQKQLICLSCECDGLHLCVHKSTLIFTLEENPSRRRFWDDVFLLDVRIRSPQAAWGTFPELPKVSLKLSGCPPFASASVLLWLLAPRVDFSLSLSSTHLSLQWQLFIILFSILCFPSSFPPLQTNTHTHTPTSCRAPPWKRESTVSKMKKKNVQLEGEGGKESFMKYRNNFSICESLQHMSERERDKSQ